MAFIGRLSVIFRGARRGGSERARALRFREDEGHRIRNLIAAPNVRMSEEGLGGLSLVPVPNTTDSTMYAELYNLGGLAGQHELYRRQASTLFFQDAYVEFITLATIPSSNSFVHRERAKLRRMLIDEFSRPDHPRNLNSTDRGSHIQYTIHEVERRVRALRILRESLRPPLREVS